MLFWACGASANGVWWPYALQEFLGGGRHSARPSPSVGAQAGLAGPSISADLARARAAYQRQQQVADEAQAQEQAETLLADAPVEVEAYYEMSGAVAAAGLMAEQSLLCEEVVAGRSRGRLPTPAHPAGLPHNARTLEMARRAVGSVEGRGQMAAAGGAGGAHADGLYALD